MFDTLDLNLYCFFFAVEGDDYSAISADLVFDDAERERRVTFQIFNDLLSEGLETFVLELKDAEGRVVNSSLVEIVDDESELVCV